MAVVGTLFLVNVTTAELYPMAWVDEVYFADPAINLMRGYGLTSSVWGHAYWGQFWVSYPPLYSLLLSCWMHLVGVKLGSLRLLNEIWISGAAILLWHFTVRSAWFPSLRGRLVVVLLPLLGYGSSFAYRSVRPDVLGILLALLALEASTLRAPRWRAAALILIGALLPWTSLSLPVFAGIMALLIAIWWFGHALRLFLPLVIGVGLGLISLFGLYLAEGRLYAFLFATFGSFNAITGQVARLIVINDPRSWERLDEIRSLLLAAVFTDRSSAFLSAAAILMLMALRHSTQTIAVNASRFAVAAAFGIPILMQLAGRYSLYYTWMGLLTVGIAVVVSLENSARSPGFLPARRLAIGCVALALAIGLPLQLAMAYHARDGRNYDVLRAYVRARIAAGDWVYITPTPYFAAVELGAVPVLNDYAWGRLARGIPEDQRERIKSIIVSPDEAQAAIDRLGGSWKRDGSPFTPPPVKRLTWGEFDNGYDLEAYRRD